MQKKVLYISLVAIVLYYVYTKYINNGKVVLWGNVGSSATNVETTKTRK